MNNSTSDFEQPASFRKYTSIKIPVNLAKQVDEYIANSRLNYSSRTEFVVECIRLRIA